MQRDREYTPAAKESELPLFAGMMDSAVTASMVEPPPKPESTQDKELRRVTGRLAESILQFFDAHQVGEQFHAADLHQFVSDRIGAAPGSADRVMRQLRSAGQLNYEVVNRAKSLYRKVG